MYHRRMLQDHKEGAEEEISDSALSNWRGQEGFTQRNLNRILKNKHIWQVTEWGNEWSTKRKTLSNLEGKKVANAGGRKSFSDN